MRSIPGPGLENQSALRTFCRVAGPLVLLAALGLAGTALVDFFGAFNSPELGAQPTKFWMFFVAVPLFGLGAWLTQAGYLGVAARYTAGETMPVVKDSAAYLTDGEGLLGVGRTVDDHGVAATGPYCRSCGVRNDGHARFCDGCGRSLA